MRRIELSPEAPPSSPVADDEAARQILDGLNPEQRGDAVVTTVAYHGSGTIGSTPEEAQEAFRHGATTCREAVFDTVYCSG